MDIQGASLVSRVPFTPVTDHDFPQVMGNADNVPHREPDYVARDIPVVYKPMLLASCVFSGGFAQGIPGQNCMQCIMMKGHVFEVMHVILRDVDPDLELTIIAVTLATDEDNDVESVVVPEPLLGSR